MKNTICFLMLPVLLLMSCGRDKGPQGAADLSLLEDIPTVQAFTDESVPKGDVDRILRAGINAQSAMNGSDYDAGLATQMMAVEAVLLGYGTKIISSPTIVLNGEDKDEYKAILGIPDGMSVKGVLLVGKPDQTKSDSVSGATPRKDTGEVVSYIGK